MAITVCPQCNKKISDKAKHCPHCQVDMDMDEVERERLAVQRRNRVIKSLNTQSLIAVVLALAGVFVMYFQTPDQDSLQLLMSRAAVGIGFLWYVINRIRHFMLKHMAK